MNPSMLQEQLGEVTQRALRIDVRPFEGRERGVLEKELVPLVITVVSDGLGVLNGVLAHYEAGLTPEALQADEGTDDAFYKGIDELVASDQGSQRVADIAFMARWELQAKKQILEVRGSDLDGWSTLSMCGSARRRLIKSTVAVELVLCQHEGIDSQLQKLHVTELRRSLETRRAYASFTKAITKRGDSEDLKARLRRGGTAIATLIGRDIYADLRASDRKQLRALQGEILAWLRGDDAFGSETATRLCENLEVFANVLLQVNHRAELQEHDRAVLAETYASLFSSDSSPETTPLAVAAKLEALLGRDRELDELIETSGSLAAGDWQGPMRRLLQALDTGPDGQDATGEETKWGEPASSMNFRFQ